jgi:hypothetical protein
MRRGLIVAGALGKRTVSHEARGPTVGHDKWCEPELPPRKARGLGIPDSHACGEPATGKREEFLVVSQFEI